MYIIYGREHCHNCDRVKKFLTENSLEFEYKSLDEDYEFNSLKALVPNVKSFQQIFLDGKNIGGYTELIASI